MKKQIQEKSRIESEAAFQNRRTEQGANNEPRAKFYYLAEKAKDDYDRALSPIQGKRVLVVGCADGGITPLAREGGIVTGIDIADQAIRKLNGAIAREGLENRATCTIMNAEELCFRQDTFDVICCTGVLHHLHVANAASSWAGALKPSGRVVMIEPMAFHPLVVLYRLLTPSQRTPDEHPLTPKDIKVLQANFGQVQVTGYALTSVLSLTWVFLPDFLSMKTRSLNVLQRIDSWILERFPSLKYLCWTCLVVASQPLKLEAKKTNTARA